MPFSAAAGAVAAVAVSGGALALGIPAAVRAVQREVDTRYRRAEAWLAIYSVVHPVLPFGPIQPYQATPEFLRCLVLLVLQGRPGLIVELGSGLSTVLAAYCVSRTGRGRILSVDSDARFCQATGQLLRAHGLERHVRLIHAPLVPVEGDRFRSHWYDPRVVRAAIDEEQQSIELLVVDGPPGQDQPLARLPALPLLHDRLAANAVILVDDARRKDEQAMVGDWIRRDGGFRREDLATEKGTIILRRS